MNGCSLEHLCMGTVIFLCYHKVTEEEGKQKSVKMERNNMDTKKSPAPLPPWGRNSRSSDLIT